MLVRSSYSLPGWQVVKLTFFKPWLLQRIKRWKADTEKQKITRQIDESVTTVVVQGPNWGCSWDEVFALLYFRSVCAIWLFKEKYQFVEVTLGWHKADVDVAAIDCCITLYKQMYFLK